METLSQAIDRLSFEAPDQLLCIHPIAPSDSPEWRRVTMKELASAVNRTAVWIQNNIPTTSKSEVIAYIGANDIRYFSFILACMKTGFKPLLLSPRNSGEAFLHVLSKTKCSKIVYSVERSQIVTFIQTLVTKTETWEIPSLWDIFNDSIINYTPSEKFTNTENETAVIIHTSGTTGLPKPVFLTHGFFLALKKSATLSTPAKRLSVLQFILNKDKLMFVMTPFFHVMGVFCFAATIFRETTFVLCPERPFTAELLARVCNDTSPKTGVLPPIVIEALASSTLGLNTLAQFQVLIYGSAPLSPVIGNKVSQIVPLQSIYGSSETGLIDSLTPTEVEDWSYLEWNPFYPHRMEDVGDGVFELVLPKDGKESDDAVCVFHTHQGNTYRTGDGFIPHPEKRGLWKYYGRIDDLIVFSNGEKLNPSSMEKVIEGHSLVSRAVIAGQGKEQAVLLIEPDWTQTSTELLDHDHLISRIWPIVEQANDTAPTYGKIMKSKIAIASSSKPFQITPKGTTRRKLVISDYADTIESLYAQQEKVDGESGLLSPESSPAEVLDFVLGIVKSILAVDQLDPDEDLFNVGLDSLQVIQLSQMLQSAAFPDLPSSPGLAINPQVLYRHSTVTSISQMIYSLIHPETENSLNKSRKSQLEESESRSIKLATLIHQMTEGMVKTHSVLITGTTGSLGSYLLHDILQDPTVSKVFCLNRSADAHSKQLQSFSERGLRTTHHFSSRVEFIQVKLDEEWFGLDRAKYNTLLESVSTIIINGWKVNFNHGVESFLPLINGVRRLVDFSIQSSLRPHIHFISSISTIGAWNSTLNGPSIPEAVFENPEIVPPQGYAESKYVAEHICATASSRCGIPVSIHRVGQIAGPTTTHGSWNSQEWIPSLIASAKTMKQIPISLGLGPVQWIPSDTMSQIIVDIIRSRRVTDNSNLCTVFQIVNPNETTWEAILPSINQYIDAEIVPLEVWVNSLYSFGNPTTDTATNVPALRMIDFFQGLLLNSGDEHQIPRMETGNSLRESSTMRSLEKISPALIQLWMKQWGYQLSKKRPFPHT